MLTKLEVKGFKNLKDVSVYFGPFTCIAGHNGVGKSNLFDALKFLSASASLNLDEAAGTVRDDRHKAVDPEDLFFRSGEERAQKIFFAAEMIVPEFGIDDLGQNARASATFLRYELEIGKTGKGFGEPKLRVEREDLSYIQKSELNKHLFFECTDDWVRSAIKGKKSSPFISTRDNGRKIILHQDREESAGGRGQELAGFPGKTVLSTTRSTEAKTCVLACNELRSWRQLQFEPSALRTPDNFRVKPRLGDRGEQLPATLYKLIRNDSQFQNVFAVAERPSSSILSELSIRLATLIDEPFELGVNVDEGRELLSLVATDRFGTRLQARDLSDGTLRFLALCVLLMDSDSLGLICLEEPENGINPSRIPAIVQLLQEIAVKTDEPLSADNPLRQVIVNTHSQEVVANVMDSSLLYASSLKGALRLDHLAKTWRSKALGGRELSTGSLVSYLLGNKRALVNSTTSGPNVRVADREEVQLGLFGRDSK